MENEAGDQQELALSQALNALLLDEELSDVTIVSSLDNTRLMGNRCILASRSQVFKRMLFGNFAEATDEEIAIQYTGPVLQMILEYCYTDHIASLAESVKSTITRSQLETQMVEMEISEEERKSRTVQEEREDKEFCRNLSNLAMAADFLQLPRLGKMVMDALEEIVNGTPRLACVVFDETVVCVENVIEGSSNIGHKVCQHALRAIRSNPIQSLWGHTPAATEESAPPDALLDVAILDVTSSHIFTAEPGILELGTTSLQTVIQDQFMRTTEINLFCALVTWVKFSHDATGDEEEDTSTTDSVNATARAAAEKVSFAKELTKCMRLDRIKPSHLHGLISQSGLVDLEQLTEAYKSQALLAERRQVYHPMCRVPVWDDGCHGSHFDPSVPASPTAATTASPTTNFSTTAKAPYPHTLHNVYLQWDDMMPGTIHKWDIRVNAINTSSDAVWVGVVNTALPCREGGASSNMLSPSSDFLGNSKCGYLYGSAVGECVHGGRRVKGLPHFSQQVIISFTLDLRADSPKNGTLVAQANGFNPAILFENMLKHGHPPPARRSPHDIAANNTAPCFVPAAVLLNGAEIDFLGFQSTDTLDPTNSFD
jgi:hypothetical protein